MTVAIPLPPDEAARLDALQSYRVLDTPPERELDDLTLLAAEVCQAPLAAISLVDSRRSFYKARVGFETTESPRQGALCGYAILEPGKLMEVRDTLADPRFATSAITTQLKARFYAGYPLVNREERALGTLCVLDRVPRELTASQRTALRVLARQVVTHLELRRLVAIGEHRERMLSILSHDLRAPLAALAQQSLQQPAPPDTHALMRIAVSAERMTRAMRDMLDFTQTRLGTSLTVTPRTTNLHAICRQVVQELSYSHPGREIRLETQGPGAGNWDPDRLAQIVINLVANALRHGPSERPVTLRSCTGDVLAELSVHNDGEAISPAVQTRLFSPFFRGQPGEAGGGAVGLGLFIVRELVTASGGTVEFFSSADEGTTFTVRLPSGLFGNASVPPSLLRH